MDPELTKFLVSLSPKSKYTYLASKGKRTKSISTFAEYALNPKTSLTSEELKALVLGSDVSSHIGLLQIIGGFKRSDKSKPKVSSLAALELFCALALESPLQKQFLTVLEEIPEQAWAKAEFGRHVESGAGRRLVFRLVEHLGDFSSCSLETVLRSPHSRELFMKWGAGDLDDHHGSVDDAGSESDEAAEGEPVKWADVDEDELQIVVEPGEVILNDISLAGEMASDPLGLLDDQELHIRMTFDQPKSTRGGKGPSRRKSFHRNKSLFLSGGGPGVDAVVVDPSLESFDAEAFLSRVHKDLASDQLQTALDNVNQATKDVEVQMKNLIELNFNQFMGCKTSIDSIYNLLVEEAPDTEDSHIGRLEKSILHAQSTAVEVFGPMLERQKEAESIRRVLGILKRFSFLFKMPLTLRHCIDAQEYDKVIREYQKVKNVQSSSPVLQRVIDRVHGIIRGLREDLANKSCILGASVEGTISLLNYLVDLDFPSDPVRHLLGSHMTKMLSMIREQIEYPEMSLHDQDSDSLSNVSYSRGLGDISTETILEDEEQVAINSIPKICEIIRQYLPLTVKITDAQIKLKRELKQDGIAKEYEDELNVLVTRVLDELSAYMMTVFCDPKTDVKSSDVLKVLSLFKHLDLGMRMPTVWLETFRIACHDSVNAFLTSRFRGFIGKIGTFSDYEHILEAYVAELNNTMSEVGSVIEESAEPMGWFLSHVAPYLFESFRAFGDSLHYAAFIQTPEISNHDFVYLISNVREARLLRFPEIYDNLLRNNVVNDFDDLFEVTFDDVSILLAKLEGMLLDRYVCRKVLRVNGIIRTGVLSSGWGQENLGTLRTSSGYIDSAMLQLVIIAEETHGALESVMSLVYEEMFKLYYDLLGEIGELTRLSTMQMSLDIALLKNWMPPKVVQGTSRPLELVETTLGGILDSEMTEQVQLALKRSVKATQITGECLRNCLN